MLQQVVNVVTTMVLKLKFDIFQTETFLALYVYIYSKTNQMHQCLKFILFYFILFWNDTVHVLDGFSVHHQELKTVSTATGICQTDNDKEILLSAC